MVNRAGKRADTYREMLPRPPARISARRFVATCLILLAAGTAAPAIAEEAAHTFGELVDYPLTFPVGGDATTGDRSGFWDARADGTHHAQDILAPKLTPVYAAASGAVAYVNYSSNPADLNPERCCTLIINHDDGWRSWYIHLNNDTPGTDDGLGWGVADGILPGVPVQAGQLIGYVGDSGNCDTMAGCPPHLHFELHDPAGVIVDAFEALRAAEGLIPPDQTLAPTDPVCAPGGGEPLASLLSGSGLLRRSDAGPAVYELQGFLKVRGFDPGPLDGTFHAVTYEAVRLFQQSRSLTVDGVVGSETRAAIQAISRRPAFAALLADDDHVLVRGVRSGEVRMLKLWLRAAGYDPGRINRRYNVATVRAVRAFQAATPGLQVDGLAGPATRAALTAALHLTWPGDCP
jgi:peptidoglycan hydrolase-like protein with peptidoglycan-binding domain